MSLATSCPSCGTVFKVVEDQLKVSEGWVRCGHCQDVFNALEGLFDLQRRDSTLGGLGNRVPPTPASEAAPSASPTPPAPESRMQTSANAAPPLSAGSPGGDADSGAPATRAATAVMAGSVLADASAAPRAPAGDLHTAAPNESPHPEPVDLLAVDTVIVADDLPAPDVAAEGYTHDPWALTEEGALGGSSDRTPDTPAAAIADTAAPPAAAAEPALPSFIAHSQARRQPWEHPWVAPAAAAGLGLLLAAQLAHHWRDTLAVRYPAARPALYAMAAAAGQKLQAPTQADAVEVENASLTHPPGAEGFRLSVQVRNRSDHEVAAPHVELSLTDSGGALLSRRVLTPGDFQQAPVMAALGEGTWSLEFQTADRRVAGYTVLAFYP